MSIDGSTPISSTIRYTPFARVVPDQPPFLVEITSVFRFDRKPTSTYEERLTLWSATAFSEAIGLAEAEASRYASSLEDCSYAGLAQAYELPGTPGHGAEIFSLMRDSNLSTDGYVGAFFDTGTERQGEASER